MQERDEKGAIYHYQRYLKPLHKKRLSSITKADIFKLQKNLKNDIGNRTANKTTTLLKAMFNRAIDWELWDKNNPVRGVEKLKEKARTRYLRQQEEKQFFTALDEIINPTMQAFFYMLFYTSARCGELRAMQWKDIHQQDDMTTWEYTQSKTKNTKITPIIKQANILLEKLKTHSKNEYVFYSPTSKKGYLQSPQRAWCNGPLNLNTF